MKTLVISSISKKLITAITLLLSVIGSFPQFAQAQTFTGETRLKQDPTSLPALIYPTNSPQTVRVNAHNRRGGALTLVIRDSKGNTKHSEVTFTDTYIRRFDLAPLGAGTYTFELSNEAGQSFTRTFRIETSQARVIALGDPNEKLVDLNDTLVVLNH